MPPPDDRSLLEFLTDIEPRDRDVEPIAADAGEAERRALDNAKRRAEIENLDQDRDERKKYASRVFLLVVVWLVAIGMILVLQGFGIGKFDLSDNVLLMLIGTTTGSVVGIFLIVANYLFPRRSSSD